jgi:hypothetical protein
VIRHGWRGGAPPHLPIAEVRTSPTETAGHLPGGAPVVGSPPHLRKRFYIRAEVVRRWMRRSGHAEVVTGARGTGPLRVRGRPLSDDLDTLGRLLRGPDGLDEAADG